jgi:hypothetical protein
MECGLPTEYFYSEYQYLDSLNTYSSRNFEKEMKILALYSPIEIANWGMAMKYNHFDAWLTIVQRYLKTYPLVLACSFVNSNRSDPFKQEYIIPQMLMQWVQRHSSMVDGISYFSCLDQTSPLGKWAAYNIAIPAFSPFDDDGYSIKIKKAFTFSKPNFYTVPIANMNSLLKEQNVVDRFIAEISLILRTFNMPRILSDCLIKMRSITSSLDLLIRRAPSSDMHIVIKMLDLIRYEYYDLESVSTDSIILKSKEEDNNKKLYSDVIYTSFSSLYNKFAKRDSNTSDISDILYKLLLSTWNENYESTHIYAYSTNTNEFKDISRWCHENNYICILQVMDSESESKNIFTLLQEISAASNKEILEFFDINDYINTDNINEQWIKDNIQYLKQPIILLRRGIGFWSNQNTKPLELISIGFSVDSLKKYFSE